MATITQFACDKCRKQMLPDSRRYQFSGTLTGARGEHTSAAHHAEPVDLCSQECLYKAVDDLVRTVTAGLAVDVRA